MAFAILLYKGYISLKPESNTQENYRKKKPFMLKLSIHTKSKIQQHIRKRHRECCGLDDKCPPQVIYLNTWSPLGKSCGTLGDRSLLEDLHHWGQSFCVQQTTNKQCSMVKAWKLLL